MHNILIKGNTYPVRDQLRAMGGTWDATARGWRIPADRADEARALADWPRPSNRALSGNPKICPDVTGLCRACGTYCMGDCGGY